jgi:hypothetical protein
MAKGEERMKFFVEVPPLQADLAAIFGVRFIGHGNYVVAAETGEKALEKLTDLLTSTLGKGQVRPATKDEAEEFEKRQRHHETGVRFREQC